MKLYKAKLLIILFVSPATAMAGFSSVQDEFEIFAKKLGGCVRELGQEYGVKEASIELKKFKIDTEQVLSSKPNEENLRLLQSLSYFCGRYVSKVENFRRKATETLVCAREIIENQKGEEKSVLKAAKHINDVSILLAGSAQLRKLPRLKEIKQACETDKLALNKDYRKRHSKSIPHYARPRIKSKFEIRDIQLKAISKLSKLEDGGVLLENTKKILSSYAAPVTSCEETGGSFTLGLGLALSIGGDHSKCVSSNGEEWFRNGIKGSAGVGIGAGGSGYKEIKNVDILKRALINTPGHLEVNIGALHKLAQWQPKAEPGVEFGSADRKKGGFSIYNLTAMAGLGLQLRMFRRENDECHIVRALNADIDCKEHLKIRESFELLERTALEDEQLRSIIAKLGEEEQIILLDAAGKTNQFGVDAYVAYTKNKKPKFISVGEILEKRDLRDKFRTWAVGGR